MALALHYAAKPSTADVKEVLQPIQSAFTALREGVATELQWSILAGSLDVSKAIERQGVVRGLAGHLASAEQALQAISDRARLADGWRPTALYYHEIDAISTFVDLHAFQAQQLGRAEFLAALDSATQKGRSGGGTVTQVRAAIAA